MRSSGPVAASLLAVLLAALSGCTASASETPPPFAGCSGLTAPSPTATGLPDVTLPCFTGDDKVSLRSLRGPAVVNIWASWCGPCRQELPVVQQLADKAGDQLTVVGVDTGDRREAGASFAADRGVKLPTLFDQDNKLINALARTNLPVTVFVDATGKAYVNILPLDAVKLTQLVKEHTGVAVTL